MHRQSMSFWQRLSFWGKCLFVVLTTSAVLVYIGLIMWFLSW